MLREEVRAKAVTLCCVVVRVFVPLVLSSVAGRRTTVHILVIVTLPDGPAGVFSS